MPVPLDRARPHGRTLRIAFAVLPHSDPTSTATDALFASDGGPGIANIANRGFQAFLNGDLTDERDLVVVDHRGTGQSGAIDCPQLQQIIGDLTVKPARVIRAIGRCGRQLGRDADRYGSGDVAKDLDAVRRALGYPSISMYGLSYAGAFLSAYATRFPEHLRAVVVDAGVPTTDPRHSWTWGMDVPRSYATTAALSCRRAPACAAANPGSGSALARLAASVRRHPVRGRVNVSGLGRRRVVVDELALAGVSGDILNSGELAAVTHALARGDAQPLLRLGGEGALSAFQPDDPIVDSAGDNAAAFCNDDDFVWNRNDSVPVRRAKYRAALTALGASAFAPFSRPTWAHHWLTAYCLRWPAPDRFTPAIRKGATVTGVPVLILSGDLDTNVPTRTTHQLLRVFPDATFMHVRGAAHPAAGWSECARNAVHAFIRTLAKQSTECTKPGIVVPATSSFPRLARAAVPAEPGRGDRSTVFDHKIATVVIQTIRDSWLRSFRVPGAAGRVTGLRGGGGRFDYGTFQDHATISLRGTRFARNVAVAGTTTLTYETNVVKASVRIVCPRGRTGRLTAHGRFGFGGPYLSFIVSGSLAGRHVHVVVPAN